MLGFRCEGAWLRTEFLHLPEPAAANGGGFPKVGVPWLGSLVLTRRESYYLGTSTKGS